MALFLFSCWFFVANSLILLIGFTFRHAFRKRIEGTSQRDQHKVLTARDSSSLEPLPESATSSISNHDSLTEKEETEEELCFSFKFEYQISNYQKGNDEEPELPVKEDGKSSSNTSILKCCFLSGKDLSGFMEEPEVKLLCVEESYNSPSIFGAYEKANMAAELAISSLSEKDCQQSSEEADNSDTEHTVNNLVEIEGMTLQSFEILEQKRPLDSETNLDNEAVGENGANILSDDFSGFDSETDSVSMSDGYSVHDLVVDSDGFLSERDFDRYEHEADTTEVSKSTASYEMDGINRLEETQSQDLRDCGVESADLNYINFHMNVTSSESDLCNLGPEQKKLNQGEEESNEVENFQETSVPSSITLSVEFTDSSDDDVNYDCNFRKSPDEVIAMDNSSKLDTTEESARKESGDVKRINRSNDASSNSINTNLDAPTVTLSRSKPSSEKVDDNLRKRGLDKQVDNFDSANKVSDEGMNKYEETQPKVSHDEDYDVLELLWEHQDLIEQLRMELRRARDIGLPTILEESESPRTVEDLKPLKIDVSFLREDPMDELHRSYKSYRERMRNFDILNYQKMYAIGFLQLKDPLQSVGSRKTLVLAIQSILSQSFWSIHRRSNIDPSDRFVKELQSDLEMVYVGQTCLSWEFLRWQYEKARELPETDPYRYHYYNQVAGEFQQFQVLMQRFIENESFQGPRLPNYIRNRCVLRNLLQVPVIREDCLKEKMEDQQTGITSEMMEDIMEESIRIFWEFVKADKNDTPGILKGFMGTHVELQGPSDFDLMADIQSDLHKKEKKLKDILRTGNCLVKKFKRPKEDRSNQDIFFSQVDLKLIARVLRMSRVTTDQLVWCHKKLSKIKLVERKIYREPSFLLFPC